MKWLNYQKYESPANHIYPQNPFDSLKQNPLYLPGAFHVGIKFQGNPKEMLKLVCLVLKEIEIEW
jgi:hypothetical protein